MPIDGDSPALCRVLVLAMAALCDDPIASVLLDHKDYISDLHGTTIPLSCTPLAREPNGAAAEPQAGRRGGSPTRSPVYCSGFSRKSHGKSSCRGGEPEWRAGGRQPGEGRAGRRGNPGGVTREGRRIAAGGCCIQRISPLNLLRRISRMQGTSKDRLPECPLHWSGSVRVYRGELGEGESSRGE